MFLFSGFLSQLMSFPYSFVIHHSKVLRGGSYVEERGPLEKSITSTRRHRKKSKPSSTCGPHQLLRGPLLIHCAIHSIVATRRFLSDLSNIQLFPMSPQVPNSSFAFVRRGFLVLAASIVLSVTDTNAFAPSSTTTAFGHARTCSFSSYEHGSFTGGMSSLTKPISQRQQQSSNTLSMVAQPGVAAGAIAGAITGGLFSGGLHAIAGKSSRASDE